MDDADQLAKPPKSTGCASSSCGSSAEPGDLPPAVWDKVKRHPCYSEEAHHHYARMHVAVAPACNIQCNYCNRKYDCANESRPGVASEKITPEQAAQKVLAVAAAIPQLTVVGIAGPGDPLANPARTFRTLELVGRVAPDLKLCLSTNGLALPEHVDAIARLNVDHVTITINMIDPDIGAQIYPWVFYDHRRYTGRQAAALLSERQLRGLDMLAARGILCKVNSVMIPGVNDAHLVDVNRAVKSRGAFLHNIMPLISAPEHGTAFGLAGQRGPSARELEALRDSCEGDLRLMRHCRQCRADAVGMLGEDRSAEFAMVKLPVAPAVYDLGARAAYKNAVDLEAQAMTVARQADLAAPVAESQGDKILIAATSKGSGRINQHFGHAKEFQIYEVCATGAQFVGRRRVDLYCEDGEAAADGLSNIISAISDCVAVLVAKIGACPKSELRQAGIEPVETYAYDLIEPSAIAYFNTYLNRLRNGQAPRTPRGGGVIRRDPGIMPSVDAYPHIMEPI